MFFPAMERTKDRRGTAPMSAFAQRALIVTFPPNPLFTGVCPFGFMYVPGGQNQDLFPYYSRPTGACCHQNLKALPRERTPPPASLPVWCGGGWLDPQLLPSCHSFSAPGGGISTVFLSKFKYVGPSGPRQVASQILSSGRRKVLTKSPGRRPP